MKNTLGETKGIMFPDLLRCIIRIFFGYELDNNRRLQFSRAPGELLVYATKSDRIKSELEKENIKLEPCGTRTTINTNIMIVPQIKIIDYNFILPIPDDIISVLSNMVPNSTFHRIDLRLGYLGRTSTEQGLFVTDGLAHENNSIIYLDMPAHSIVPFEVTGYRIVHELLHCLGLEEEIVKQLDWPFFVINHDIIMPFVRVIREQLINEKQRFDNACINVENDNYNLMAELWKVERSLSAKGISLPDKSLVYTQSFCPTLEISTNTMDTMDAILNPNYVGYLIPFA